MFRKAPH